MSRELKITYGSIVMGGASTTYLLDGKYGLTESFHDHSASWRVVVVADSEAGFIAACDALEAEFRKRFLSLTIELGSETDVSSGYHEIPSITKVAEVGTTGRSRVYECGVRWKTDASDNSNRLDSTIELTEDESRRRQLTIRTRYTLSESSARSAVRSRADTISTSLGGDWDEILVTTTRDDIDEITTAVAVTREIVFDQSASGADHTSIIRPVILFDRSEQDPVRTGGKNTRPLATITARYICGVDQTATTSLDSLYENTIRPYLISKAEGIFQPSGQLAIVSEDPGLDKSGNRINATLVFRCEIDSSGVYSYRVVQAEDTNYGKIIVPVASGVETDAHVYPGHRITMRSTVIRITGSDEGIASVAPVPGHTDIADNTRDESAAPDFPDPGGEEGWVLLSHNEEREPGKLGDSDTKIPMNSASYRLVQRWITKPEAPSGGGGPVTTPSEGTGNPLEGI